MTRLIVDSASDYSLIEATKLGIKLVPLQIRFEEKSFVDEYEISKNEFYARLLNGEKASTSQPSPDDFLKYFKEAKDNNDTVICITLSSKVSGTYQSANLAKNIVEYDQIYLIDSLSAGVGLHSIVQRAYEMIQNAIEPLDIVNEIKSKVNKMEVRYVPESLSDLLRNGRLVKKEDDVNTKVKSVIKLKNGSVEEAGKYRGTRTCINAILEEIDKQVVDHTYPITLGYTTNPEYYQILKEEIVKKFKDVKIIECQIGAVVGTHFGPGVFGIGYQTK